MDLRSSLDDLVSRKLATKRLSSSGKYSIYKYSKRVFFDNLWHVSPLLNEARGIVLRESDGQLVSYPFTKVYNYGEQNAGVDLQDDDEVIAVHKINGFMGAVTVVDGEFLMTTSGSFDSPFVDMLRETLSKYPRFTPARVTDAIPYAGRHTLMFEIVHKDDPHVVVETPGAYLIGMRQTQLGSMLSGEETLDRIAEQLGLPRPRWKPMPFGAVRHLIDTEQGVEGYMIRDARSPFTPTICKFKSKHYLRLKFLSRATFFLAPDFDRRGVKQKVEEEFHPLIDWVFDVYGVEAFKALDPATRVELLRNQL